MTQADPAVTPSTGHSRSRDSQRDRKAPDFWIALLVFIVAAIPRFAWAPLSYLNTHASRDLYRAKELLAFVAGQSDVTPLAGPELYFGGRVPGFFYYILTAIPLAIWNHPYAVAFWMALLAGLAAPLTYLALRRLIGREGARAAALLYALFPLCIMEGLYMWNPSYLPFISAAALYCLARWINRGTPLWWSGAMFLGLLGMQVHLSAYTILIVGALITIAAKLRSPKFEDQLDGEGSIGGPTFRLPRLKHWVLPFAATLPLAFAYLWTEGHFFFMDIRLPEQGTSDVGLLQRGWNWGAFKTIIRGFVFFNDAGAWQQFQHFGHPLDLMGVSEFRSPVLAGLYHVAVFLSALAALALGLLGLFYLFCSLVRDPIKIVRDYSKILGVDPEKAHLTALLLLAWILVPTLILIKLTGSVPGADPLGIPTRYIVIFYPLAMAIVGLGYGLSYDAPDSETGKKGLISVPFGMVYWSSIAMYAVMLATMWWAVWSHGEIFRYSGAKDQIARPLFVEAHLAAILRDEYKISEQQFLSRFLSSEQFQDEHAEQYLDYFHFDPPAEDNPGAADLWFYLHDSVSLEGKLVPVPPMVLEDAELIQTHEIRDLVLYVLRREDSQRPVTWPQEQLVPLGVR